MKLRIAKSGIRNLITGSVTRWGLLLAVIGCAVPAFAKNYRVDQIAIEARIQADGGLRITEKRVYAFKGEFSWADYRLPLAGIGAVESLRVWEGDRLFRREDSGNPGTFVVDSTRDILWIRWHFRAKNQTRVFYLSFLIPSLIRLHRDAAELNYVFVGAGDRKKVGEVLVRVSWEKPPDPDSLRVWLHTSPGVNANSTLEDGMVRIRSLNLLPDQELGVRIVFPQSCVPRAGGHPDELTLEDILRQEAAWAVQYERAQQEYEERQWAYKQRQRHALWFVAFLTLAGCVIVGYFWFRFGKPHRVRGVPSLLTEPPSDWTPAQVAYLLRGEDFGPEAFVATLFDLVRKGVLQLEQEGVSEKKPRFRLRRGETSVALQPWEKEVVRYLFEELAADGEEVSSEELARARKKLRRWFFTWKKEVARWGEKEGIFEPTSRVARNRAFAIAAALLVIGAAYMFYAGWVGLIPLLGGIVLFALAFAMIRRSPAAQTELSRWRAFERYLRRASRGRESLEIDGTLRDRSWVYAFVLGIPPRRFRKLTEKLFGSEEVPWLGLPAGSVVSVVATVNAVTSVAGVGAGPAGGGAGGAVGGAG